MENVLNNAAANYESLDKLSTKELIEIRSNSEISAVVTCANVILNQRQFHLLSGLRNSMRSRRYAKAVKQLSRTGVWPEKLAGPMPDVTLQRPSFALR